MSVIEFSPAGDLARQAADLNRTHEGAAPAGVLEAALERFAGRIALVSSFGTESAVLLHLAASVDPGLPVLFVDTGRHFRETLAYRTELAGRLGLTNIIAIGPKPETVRRLDPFLALAEQDSDACCAFRKVEPLEEALKGYDAWISGRKRFQATTREGLSLFEVDGGRIKVNPLADWGAAELTAYARAHDLPAHPLLAEGYRSVGCAPCTSPVAEGEDARAGRWRGQAKTECGIHRSTNLSSTSDAASIRSDRLIPGVA